ncbi:MAG: hypothetical protein IJM99_07940 [Firmicutes bacterium]|nr:hypothetical protein [Bacillota bacterium]
MSKHLFLLKHILSVMKRELSAKEQELEHLPKGSLYLKHRKDSTVLCLHQTAGQSSTGERSQMILSETERSLAEDIQRRHFLEQQLPALYHNIEHLSSCIDSYQPCSDHDICSKLPMIYTAPLDYHGFDSSHQPAPSASQVLYPEGLIHKNSVGEMFRSKSEVQISELLRSMNISYVYEPQFSLGSKTVHPDFMLTHPLSGKPLLIEYFGMVDDNDYGLRMLEKIRLYLNHGYIPGRNILFLFETPTSGIDLMAVQSCIKQLTL